MRNTTHTASGNKHRKNDKEGAHGKNRAVRGRGAYVSTGLLDTPAGRCRRFTRRRTTHETNANTPQGAAAKSNDEPGHETKAGRAAAASRPSQTPPADGSVSRVKAGKRGRPRRTIRTPQGAAAKSNDEPGHETEAGQIQDSLMASPCDSSHTATAITASRTPRVDSGSPNPCNETNTASASFCQAWTSSS